MSHRPSPRVNLALAAHLAIASGSALLAGCAGIAQPAYVEDTPKAKAADCQSRGQNTQDCAKNSAAK